MKRFSSLLLILALLVGLLGCAATASEPIDAASSQTSSAESSQTASPDEETAPETAEPSSDETEPAEAAPASGTHIVVDHAGNEVEVPYNVQRVVVCDMYPLPSVLSIFFDSADKIVGMAKPSMTAAANGLLGELYPEILNAETGFIDGSNINVEELMKLEPDVVFYSTGQPEEGELLRQAGIPAIAVSAGKWGYNAIDTLTNWFALFGEVFPENEKTAIVQERSNEIYELVSSRVQDIPDAERARVFFLFQYSDTNLMTSGQQFFGQWWATAIGAVNVGQELENAGSVAVDLEQVYSWNPDLIFITNFTTAQPQDLYDNAIGSYDWSPVEAVKNQNVYKMPLGMYRSYTAGVDTPVTLLWLAKHAYPALFEDIDIVSVTKSYYQDVFGVTLTDAQAASIFSPSVDANKGF